MRYLTTLIALLVWTINVQASELSLLSETDTIPKDSIINNIPIISLSEGEIEADDELENISGLLTAGNDLFTNTAAFNFGVARFRMRGYSNNATEIYINGSSMNDLETGGTYWSMWGGLNDVFRNRNVSMGLDATEFAFGGLNGANNIDIGAASQRKQKRISYASSNRSYFHRLMAVYTPELKNDWFLTVSGSRRWAEEGYQDGTFYDSWSYFVGVEKKLMEGKHSIALNALGSPTTRGRSSASILEYYNVVGNKYNPNWGYQNGEKRNSRVNKGHQPVFVLQHQWNINEKSNLSTSASYQFGFNGGTALDWNNARDPRPDYWRNIPSNSSSEEIQETLAQIFEDNPEFMQVNWDQLYQSNFNSPEITVEDVDGIVGNTATGKWARYVVESRRYDRKKFDFNINFNTELTDKITLNSGAYFRKQSTHNHKRIDDLLGADFYINYDRFADLGGEDFESAIQNDLNKPNDILEEGDIFGYSYDSNIDKYGAWVQGQISLDKFDIFAAVNGGMTQFWRVGNFRTGRFPENSFGASEKVNFTDFRAKLGATYKINGRNYLFANAAYMMAPPSYREAYVAPRVNDQVLPGITEEISTTVEGGYFLRSLKYKVRATGYYSKFSDGIDVINFYNDGANAFGALIRNGVNRQHMGIEVAADIQILTGLSLTGVAALGQYTYTNRPTMFFQQDNELFSQENANPATVYQKNFYVPNTPQRAYSVGLKYNSPKYWFANINFNYFDELYTDFNPIVRSDQSAFFTDDDFNIETDFEIFQNAIVQEELPNQYTVDIFGGKSWNFDYKYYLYLTVGVSNILNNRDFRTGGFEQLRNRTDGSDIIPNKYYFAFGTNYFAQIAFRF